MGRIQFGIVPADSDNERERYRRAGELSYVEQRATDAVKYISKDPTRFLRQTFYRFRYWWFAEGESAPIFSLYRLFSLASVLGLALSLRNFRQPERLTIVASLLVYPLVYYFTNVFAPYRYPAEPLMMMFVAFLASQILIVVKKKVKHV